MQKLKAVGRAANGTGNNWPARRSQLRKHRVINHAGQQRAAGACKKCLECWARRPGAGCGVRSTQRPSGVKPLISFQICGKARSRGSAQGSSAWLEPRAVTGWRKRAWRSQVAVKCLISLKTTGEQEAILSTVGPRRASCRPTGRGELQ